MSQTVKKVIIGNDQGAVDLKFRLMKALEERGIDVENCGIDSEESIDYPDMAQDVCGRFLKGDYDLGILCCGTGIGISISANKIKGIRCALLYDTYSAEMARNHNDANFIAFGGRIHYHEPVEDIMNKFIDTSFDGPGRHQRRVDKIMALEK